MLAVAVGVFTLSASAQFVQVKPGGDTLCAKGGEFSFFHRAGTVNKIVLEFEGGGACWSGLTCNPIASACTTSVDTTAEALNTGGSSGGIHSANNTANPFLGWYHVFVPYCTCDAHTGVKDHNYGGISGTINHRGHTNYLAVMDWVKSNFPKNPDMFATTGCSAGSVGALAKWAFLAEAYPDAQQVVFGDSFLGVFGADSYNSGYSNWGLTLPPLAGFDPSSFSKWHPDMCCNLHNVSSNAFPKARLAWYTSNADQVQSEFYSLGGGKGSWTDQMRSEASCIHATTANELTFIAAGNNHCRSQDDGFYSVTSAGVNLAAWVSSVISGDSNARNIDCAASGECNSTLASAPSALSLTKHAYRPPYKH